MKKLFEYYFFVGKNVEPFCAKPKYPYFSPDSRHASVIFDKCAPVYYSTQSPQTSCSAFSRCCMFLVRKKYIILI